MNTCILVYIYIYIYMWWFPGGSIPPPELGVSGHLGPGSARPETPLSSHLGPGAARPETPQGEGGVSSHPGPATYMYL